MRKAERRKVYEKREPSRSNSSLIHRSAFCLLLCLILLSTLCSGVFSRTSGAPAPVRVTLLKVGRLLDVKTGAYLLNQGVLVEDGRIREVGKFERVKRGLPKGATIIDLGGATLLPGLIDCHSHLFLSNDGRLDRTSGLSEEERQRVAERNALELLTAGVTTVRNLGHSGIRGDVLLRDAINARNIPGLRILAATRKLTPPDGQPLTGGTVSKEILRRDFLPISNTQEARAAVLQVVDAGADVIKVVVDVGAKLLSLEEMKAIVEEAHRAKIKVAAHATTRDGAKVAAEAGVDSIEHGNEASDETFRLMAARGIFLVPTDFTPDSIRAVFAADLERNPKERDDFEGYIKDYSAKMPERLRRAVKAGVRIASGSDMIFMYPGKTRGQASLLVLEALNSEGLPPLDCIRAATINAAELLGWQDRIGTIEAGKLADLIAVEGDPLKDLSEFQRVRFVMKGGVLIKD
jgi:imidazolonepropionase-like amidohydrolase